MSINSSMNLKMWKKKKKILTKWCW